MMELTCAFILISASLVLATPSGYGGYGVKGGASARAESSASAGAFPGIPVAVPLGAGYSGSFSKSASSSSASSSASSSSSSSSFSYSGSGTGGFGLHEGASGHGGCSSGNCPNARGNEEPTLHGSSVQGYNSANAAASAEAVAGAVSGLGCQGSSCDGNSEKCSSGSCKTRTTTVDSDSNKCTSGQCGSASESGASPTDHDSNDIHVVTDSAHNANHQSSSYHQRPSTHLETPKDISKCKSGNCNAVPGEPGHQSSPSSYHVPIHGAYDSGVPKLPADHATGGPSGSVRPGNDNFGHSPSHAPVAPVHIGYGKPSDANNKLPNDKLPPYKGGFGGPAGILSVNDVPVTANPNPANTPQDGKPISSAPTGCNAPSCSVPGPTAGLTPTGTYNHRPGGDIPSDKLPTYTGGFGAPAGTLKPSGFDIHGTVTTKPTGGYSPTTGATSEATAPYGPSGVTKPIRDVSTAAPNQPQYTGGFGGPPGTLKPGEHNSPGCNGGNCVNYPISGSSAGANANAQSGSFGVTKPHSDVAPNQSQYTSGFGGPPGTLKPFEHNSPGCNGGNCVNYPSGPSTGANAQPGSFGVTKPHSDAAPNQSQYTGGFGGPPGTLKPGEHNSPGCNGRNCANFAISGPSAGANAQPGSFGVTKPHLDAAPNQPQYTGGFGGPPGTLKPGEHNSPSCNGGNCANYPISGPSADANAQPGSFGVTKPHLVAAPNQPQYTDGFGGPPGTLKPGEHNSPSCNGGNCANYPISGPSAGANAQPGSFGVTKPHLVAAPNQPQYTDGFGGPPGTLKPGEHNSPSCNGGNCANYPISGPSAGANGQPGLFGATKPHLDSAPNQPQYTGGFGGPPGTLKPGEHNSPSCNGGNCANYPISGPSAGANGQPGLFGVTKPHLDSAPNQPQYTGGFGGPPGTLKPGEHNSPSCNGGNCAHYPISGPSAGANAQPGSFGVTKPHLDAAPNQPQYTGGFGGPSGTLKPDEHNSPGCNGGNCANIPISGPSAAGAGANAQLGSYGITKPSDENNPSNEKPNYTGGFGGPAGLLKPNDYTVPVVSPIPLNKPHGSVPLAHNVASGGAHATAAAAADANAIAYPGDFGGSPGVLAPFDDGKIETLPAHGSHNAHIHSQHGIIPGANGGATGLAGARGNTGAQAGSPVGAASYAGAAAGATAGSYGYNPHGSYNHAGNVKGGSPCGGGCGGSGGGGKDGGSALEFGAGPGFPKLGLSGGGITFGSAGKSLGGANAFGLGGSFGSSSASAQSFAGAFTKGGYGKR